MRWLLRNAIIRLLVLLFVLGVVTERALLMEDRRESVIAPPSIQIPLAVSPAGGVTVTKNAKTTPLFTFGLVTDVHHGNKDSSPDEHGFLREYHCSLEKLQAAVNGINAYDRYKVPVGEHDVKHPEKETEDERTARSKPEGQMVSFVIQLGDLVDPGVSCVDEVRQAVAVLDKLDCVSRTGGMFHTIGNHDFVIDRSLLLPELKMKQSYYSFRCFAGWRIIVLDSTDISTHYPPDHAHHKQALEWMAANKAAPNAVDWNGGLSREQLSWFKQQLLDATQVKEKVIVMCHNPVLAEAAAPTHLLYNSAEVLEILSIFPCIVAFIAGHYHPGGYAVRNNCHHVTMQSILQAPKLSTSYALIEVHDDVVIIRGVGFMKSHFLEFNNPFLLVN